MTKRKRGPRQPLSYGRFDTAAAPSKSAIPLLSIHGWLAIADTSQQC
jgi:hypothetical protein